MKTMLFNPYTGTPRHPSDISSDPEGILLLDPDEPVKSAPPQASQPLTNEQIEQCMKQAHLTVQGRNLENAFARAIEAAHGIGAQKARAAIAATGETK